MRRTQRRIAVNDRAERSDAIEQPLTKRAAELLTLAGLGKCELGGSAQRRDQRHGKRSGPESEFLAASQQERLDWRAGPATAAGDQRSNPLGRVNLVSTDADEVDPPVTQRLPPLPQTPAAAHNK